MTTFASDTERKAAMAAIANGQFNQITHLFDEIKDIDDRLESVEKGGSSHHHPLSNPFEGVEPVAVPSDDARGADVRDVVIDLVEKFNAIVAKANG